MAQIQFPSHISIASLVMVILFTTTSPIFATEDCHFPAIFNFGASNSDTGGLAAAFEAPGSPFGITYFNRSTGRYSDGRIILDFIGNNALYFIYCIFYRWKMNTPLSFSFIYVFFTKKYVTL